MNIHYRVELTLEERHELKMIIGGGSNKARRVKRAQVLLAVDKAAEGERLSDEDVARTIGVGTSTVFRVKRKFVELGLEAALSEEPRPGGNRKTTQEHETTLIALACSEPPNGRAKWTLRLLAGAMVELTDLPSISPETVRRRLEENELKPWQHKMWCIPQFDMEFVARMEDLLDLYAEPEDPKRPVVCFDETPRQLIGETRVPVLAKPGRKMRYDYEYKRNGTANLFVFIDKYRAWRYVEVTDRRTNADFAEQMRKLVDEHYPNAERIRIVMDNLSTHKPGSLYAAFPPEEARRILRKLEFHYTPKHASWLNMAEIEISSIVAQCLDRRIGDKATLVTELQEYVKQRNSEGATIHWMFSLEKARVKMAGAYRSEPLS